MFANLPLIGKLLEDEENLPTINDAFDYLRKNSLLTEWLYPQGKRTQQDYGQLMNKLIGEKTPHGKDSFLHGLLQQLR